MAYYLMQTWFLWQFINRIGRERHKNVYQITDGMEGDAVKDPLSVYNGKRIRNGWKNSGRPWTYKPDPERILMPVVPKSLNTP